ncbi:hypothetical protein [Puniceibacterium sediminis]|uniref:Uncharacterized protein n=1 Tax=Puniceibacterium sediminis TaxID=1608407 RepID=A0A238UXD4_9RHOB|nr:hypothetical protein [Puniceibacterium sediminis]SNR26902.1 hypothetical protein SAMN06265370_101304 [Puniceibacterium sediminis]
MLRAIVLTACLCAAPMAEAAQIYICRIADTGRSGWIPEILFVGREDGADTVTISDPIILYYNDGAPVSGKVAADNAKRTTFVWSISVKSNHGQYIRNFQYTATYLKQAKKMLLSATPIGYTNHFKGEGTCAVEVR